MPLRPCLWRCAALSLAPLFVLGCAAPAGAGDKAKPPQTPSAAPAPADLQRTWRLVAMPGFTRAQLQAAQASTDWRTLPQAGAYMGCNRMGYTVTLREPLPQGGRSLRMGNVFSTRMACQDMRLENDFGRLLPTMQQVHLQGPRLTLSNAAGQTMEFVAADGN